MTTIGTGPTWLDRLNPRNWTLVWKLVVVGLAPALLALSLGALRIADQAGSAAALGDDARLFDLRTQVATVGDAVRAESTQAALYVAAGRTGDRGGLDAATAKTDAAVGALRGATTATSTVLDTAAATASSQALNGLGKLATLRPQVTDDKTVAPVQVNNTYGQIAEGVDVFDRVLLREVRIPDTAGLVDALTAARNVESQLATQHTLIAAAIRAPGFNPGDREAVAGTDVQIFAQYRAYQLALTPEQLQKYGTFLDDPANIKRQQIAADALRTGINLPGAQPPIPTAPDWDAAYDGSRAALEKSTTLLRQDVSAAGTAAGQRAQNQAGINSVVLMLGLLIGITIAVLVARSLIRSLRVLRSAALDVAERRLPLAVESMRAGDVPDVTVDPVPIGTRDEVGQVARAFDAVHGQAVRLAADQAALQSNVSAMFVNLSRRSQALVERQLQLIEQLESNEQDADQLSNLFQLDHLATRMRRNSENLLVLAGTDLAKRNVAPVPMVDVLRAAVSEVEQYQRIVVQAPPTISIAGRAGSDLVHLLAELLDNATNFSPPDSQVVMSTTRTPDGSIMVEIADRGVGMADHELSDANQRLSGPSTVDVSASRRMGLFVVGRLGARHGINVRLAGSGNGPASGLTASVIVPASLVPTAVPADIGRPIGRPVPAAVPAQARPAERAASQQPTAETNGSRGPSALVSRPAETAGDAPATGSGPAPRPAVNGTVNGLPSRTPGSSLRPTGPTDPPKDDMGGRGYFDDGSGDPPERADADRSRSVAEQARLDQEAAARRDRLRQAAAGRAAAAEQVAPADEKDGQAPHPFADLSDATAATAERDDAGADGEPAGHDEPEQALPRRDTSRRDPTGRTAAGQDAAGRTAAGQDIAGQDAAGRDTTGQDAAGQDAAGRDAAGWDTAGQDAAGRALTGRDVAGRDVAGRDAVGRADRVDDDATAAARADAESDGDPKLDATAFGAGGHAERPAPGQARPDLDGGGARPPLLPQAFERGPESARDDTPAGEAPSGRGADDERPSALPPLPTRPTRPAVAPSPMTAPLPAVARGEDRPSEAPPAQARPGADQPVEARSAQASSGAEQPVEARSPQAQSHTDQPLEARSPQAQPHMDQPLEARSAQASSGAEQPLEARSPQAQPGTGRPADAWPAQDPWIDAPSADDGPSTIETGDRRSPGGDARPAGPYDLARPGPEQPGPAGAPLSQPPAPPRPAPGTGNGHPNGPPSGAFGQQGPGAAPAWPAPNPEPSRPATYDELFAPSVPGLDGGPRPGGAERAFDLGETTPIFEEIASAWFRSNRPIPVSWPEEDGRGAPPAPQDAAGAAAAAPQQPDAPRPVEPSRDAQRAAEAPRPFGAQRPAEAPRPFETSRDAHRPFETPRPFEAPRPPEQPRTDDQEPLAAAQVASPEPQAAGTRPESQPEPGAAPAPEPEDVSAFATAADEGWRAASGAETDRPDEITAAGLPKRRPRARLVPGSAGSAVLSRPAAAHRSAEDIRGRLSSYQQGVRQGRETRLRGAEEPAGRPTPTGDDDPES